jgi:hypothetical protein
MSGATDCQLETALKPAPKRKTLHFCGLTSSHFKFRVWDGTSVISLLVARFGLIPSRLNSAQKFGP